jgi:hypothetical protein
MVGGNYWIWTQLTILSSRPIDLEAGLLNLKLENREDIYSFYKKCQLIDDLSEDKTGSAHTLGSTACRTSCVVSPGETGPVSATFSGVLTWIFKYSEQAIAIAKTIFSNILAAPPLSTSCDLTLLRSAFLLCHE